MSEDWSLRQKQSLPLEAKVILTKRRIREWYDYWDGMVCVAFSGGYDSRVLLELVREEYPDVPAVFLNTGLEFPEIPEFVKTFDNVVWLKPDMLFTEVIKRYGYPVVSKKVSMGISRYRNTKSEEQRNLRMYGGINPSSGREQERSIPIKFHYLLDAPFKISEACCDVMKKKPLKRYAKESGRKFITGEMAGDSEDRKKMYLQTGCNAYDAGFPKSMPLSVWTKEDVQEYSRLFNVKQCSIYEMGYDRTGCVFCMFGCHKEPAPGRFVLMKKTHPALHKYCLDQLGLRYVLNYLGVDYE